MSTKKHFHVPKQESAADGETADYELAQNAIRVVARLKVAAQRRDTVSCALGPCKGVAVLANERAI